MIELPRRKFLAGLAGIIAAPAIVRASSIMPVRTHRFDDIRALLDARMAEVERQFREAFANAMFSVAMYGEATIPMPNFA